MAAKLYLKKFKDTWNYYRRYSKPVKDVNIPLHYTLNLCGFIKYVDRLKAKSETRLFPELKNITSTKKYSKYYSGIFKRISEQYGFRVDNEKARTTFHSFRHTFKDACRNANLNPEITNTLMGHSKDKRDVGASYGMGAHLAVHNAELQKINYPGLELKHVLLKLQKRK